MEEELPVDPFGFCMGEQEKWGKTWRKFGPLLLCSKFQDVQSNVRVTTPARWRGDALVILLNKLGFNEANFDTRDFLRMAPVGQNPRRCFGESPLRSSVRSLFGGSPMECVVFFHQKTPLWMSFDEPNLVRALELIHELHHRPFAKEQAVRGRELFVPGQFVTPGLRSGDEKFYQIDRKHSFLEIMKGGEWGFQFAREGEVTE